MLLFAGVLTFSSDPASAAAVIWNNMSNDGLFATDANWTRGTAPENNDFRDVATFDNAAIAGTVTLASNRSVGGLDFATSNWNLSGSSQLTFKTLSSSGAGSSAVSLNLKTAQGNYSWSVGSGNQLNLSSLIQDGSGRTLSLSGGGTLNVTGGLKVAFSSADNDFIINDGLLKLDTATPYRSGSSANNSSVTINSATSFLELQTTEANALSQIGSRILDGTGNGLSVTNLGGGSVRISAVPEPSALLLSTLGALALHRRRRN